ncbi:hypothetical protein B0T22DRAFT_181635 [Podospora appendiculata]|uniref:Uncharacterized protein n=1 Tax=Podospora appendiculata TaxID=314037 RepID=A0AAE1CDM6_9PEZI|nr:hypothetical protein B0T22DRAFT_181635 [Podospora appendiculata]
MTSYTRSFSARYTDENTIYEQLTSIFPMGNVGVVYQRGRFICSTPRALTSGEVNTINAALKANHYDSE